MFRYVAICFSIWNFIKCVIILLCLPQIPVLSQDIWPCGRASTVRRTRLESWMQAGQTMTTSVILLAPCVENGTAPASRFQMYY